MMELLEIRQVDIIDFVPRHASADDADGRSARLTALAVKAFGNRDQALRWLRRPRREFGGATPLDMVETEAATRQVELMLAQLVAHRDH
jgi:uncharacterized protein (DUF2384 family)